MPKFLRAAYFALIVALPAVLFFSYYPIISLGANSSMNFELSLPLLWLVLFDFTAFANFVIFYREHKASGAQQKAEKMSRKRGFKGFCEGIRLGLAPRSGKNEKASSRGFATFFEDHKDSAMRPKAGKKHGDRTFMMFFESIKTWPRGPERSSKKTIIKVLILLLFPLYATLSVFWSENPLRTILTSGILWLLFFAIFAILRLSPLLEPPCKLKIWVIRALFASTAVVCLFCFVQSLLDSCGLSRETTLLCAGCTYRSFGFPHPNGFAIEPQFMGNLLLAPTLLTLYLLCQIASKTTPRPNKTEHRTKTEHIKTEQTTTTFPHLRKTSIKLALVACAILFSTTLFFTFSRGAIYSYALGLLILIIFTLHRHTFRPALIIIPVATFLLSLGLQGTFAHFGPTSETFTSAVTKSIHQLSLGLIDLRPTNRVESGGGVTMDRGSDESFEGTNSQADAGSLSPLGRIDYATPSGEHSESVTVPPKDSSAPVFNGYVPESTDVRLGLNSAALATWSQSPATMIFGVGLGGAGVAMHRFDPVNNPSPKEIVQNQPISLLLETGLLGVALLLAALYFAFRSKPLEDPQNLPFLVALITAYLLSLQFFAGLPNALHIYLLPPLLYYIFLPSYATIHSNSSTLPNHPKTVKISKNSTKSLPKLQNKHKHS